MGTGSNITYVPYAGLMQRVPDAIDIISADIYVINEGYEPAAVRKVYREHVYPALAPHQRVMQVPGLFADARLSNTTNSKVLLEKVNGFWDWAQNDTLVVGINPWHCTERTSEQSHNTPLAHQELQAFPERSLLLVFVRLLRRREYLGQHFSKITTIHAWSSRVSSSSRSTARDRENHQAKRRRWIRGPWHSLACVVARELTNVRAC